MGRSATIRVGALSALLVGAVALSGVGSESSASAIPAEVHAPRIPGPTPGRTPTPTPSPTPTPALRPFAMPVVQSWTSLNWSGYALTGTGFTSVVGTWRVPQVLRPTKKRRTNRYSSSWVGIDGFNNTHLIQAGTEQDWVHGAAFYQAWWEILPASETPIGSLTIHPGDAMSVSITEDASPFWTIQVTDTTTSQTFSTVKNYFGPTTSAEWIQEAPTIGRHVAKLAQDSNTIFDHGLLDGANPGLTVSNSGAMFKGRTQISTPSAPNPNRDGFAVAFGSVAPPAPSS